ncbi:MAG: hypothetical protein IPN46_10215 [Saprospiraceae bacterium]|nr:hypothetical protein [Saprospiraceae bacterium]
MLACQPYVIVFTSTCSIGGVTGISVGYSAPAGAYLGTSLGTFSGTLLQQEGRNWYWITI